ncbi:MAG: AbrB/MazE/SpoVT family DNA-binding domain-containing protein, partial [Candidatus Nanoarchaeia archaeon]
MERKLVKQGQNALTVTLPAKWLKQKGLKAGGSVFLEVENNSVVVKSSVKSQKKEMTIDV